MWTHCQEVFTISKVQPTIPFTYKITDANDEEIRGTFYSEELQKTTQENFRIEKVLKQRRIKGGRKEIYVKWKGYNSSFNQWIPEVDIVPPLVSTE